MEAKKKVRPPVVTILGHVDHGKTTLLDAIRKSKLADKEAGGITQRIGGYEIATGIKDYGNDRITFIDTPGHEAFAKLRARGALVADIALLVIDGKDSIMPQTSESIAHIKSANIPFIVVITKADLPDINAEKVKNDLLKEEVMVEGKGGTVPVVAVSAKTGLGLQELLESILLIAEDLHLQYDENAPIKVYVIETKKDKRGIIVSCIIKDGKLKIGDTVYGGEKTIKIRSLLSDNGLVMQEVTPSLPFEILGADFEVPVGTLISSTKGQEAKLTVPVEANPNEKAFDMKAFLGPAKEKNETLSLVIKADSMGSLEAVKNSLAKQDNIEIVLSGVGNINNSDIFLAKTMKSIVIGFGIEVTEGIKDLSKQEKVVIKTYSVIYELLEELNEVADLLNEKEIQEKHLKGEAKVLAVFVIEGEKVFGVKITKGKIHVNDKIEIFRGENLLGKSELISLKMRAKVVAEVKKDQEAGMLFNPPLDIRMGDVVKSIS